MYLTGTSEGFKNAQAAAEHAAKIARGGAFKVCSRDDEFYVAFLSPIPRYAGQVEFIANDTR